MLRVVSHKSANAALKYYSEGLKREDYYSEGQEAVGKWYGKAAEMLGLSGKVTPEAFAAFVHNQNPVTGKKLTPRTKAERIVGYDLNFNAPKSLSVLYALTQDKAILEAFRASVAETMGELESRAATRVRINGAQELRQTGNLAWAEFIHFTSRPVGGIPDPHLHIHCFAFNATHDSVENRWKAANFGEIKREAPFSQALFHSKLTERLVALGYGIKKTPGGWDIEGIPSSIVDKFSRRTQQIERLAQERGVENAKDKDDLGAASREGKRHGMTLLELEQAWEARIAPEEHAALVRVYNGRNKPVAAPTEKRKIDDPLAADKALDSACHKLFAKHSVVEVNRLLAEGMRFGFGRVTLDSIQAAFMRKGMVVKEIEGKLLCTSLDILAEEASLIYSVRAGRGEHSPLAKAGVRNSLAGHPILSPEQQDAAWHVLSCRDQVIAVRGAAGVGKTTLMKEVVAAIEAGGKRVFAFAPSADASRGTLRKEGFAGAETVARLLVDTSLQQKVRGQVIWIDEAGLLGVRDMWKVLQLAGNNTRLILTGDTQQHAPVARGDAFRLLQGHAGLVVAEVTKIRRQEREEYRAVVEALSKGDMAAAFLKLDRLGAIREVENSKERYDLLAKDYVNLCRGGNTPLVVSPTHAEGALVTDAIRRALRAEGRLGKEQSFWRYHNLHWEEADRRQAEFYKAGLVVQFNQNVPGIRRGSLFEVKGCDENGAVIMEGATGKLTILPLNHADRFQVFERRELALAKGDKIRITRNGESFDGRRLNNGEIFAITGIDRKGNLVLSTGAILDASHGHITYGYCSTSHSSQSKSIRDVLVAQSSDSFLASSQEQFYVSVSRGKQTIRIYTDDRRELQAAVGNTSTRLSGMEFVGLGQAELSPFMEDKALNGDEWRSRIRSRHADGETKSFVETLARQRNQDHSKKAEVIDWKEYIAMRRANITADGKNRARTGQEPKKLSGDKVFQQRKSTIRPTSPSKPLEGQQQTAEVGQPAKPKQETGTTEEKKVAGIGKAQVQRIKSAVDSSAKHFKAVLEKLPKPSGEAQAKEAKPKSEGVPPPRDRKTIIEQAVKNHNKHKTEAPTKAPPVPTAVVRRGK